jgi:hypothetical protein
MRAVSVGQPFIIVTGAGRSGTSAVARVLHESGVRMGNSLAPPTEANREGFYEDLDVVDVNERLLADIGMSDPWRPERWASRTDVLSAAKPYHPEMRALARTGVDGWKDPRFAITLEAWLPALTSPPKVVVCLRSPQAYAGSVTAIYGLVKPERAMREWSRHYRRLLAVIRAHKLKATCVEYDALIEQPGDVIESLARFVGRPLDTNYVVPALRRQHAPVPLQHRALHARVARLGDAPSTPVRWVRGQGSRVKAKKPTTDYSRHVCDVIERLAEAQAAWTSVVDMTEIRSTRRMRAACEEYNSRLIEAQCAIAGLMPPPRRRRAHNELARRINIERMTAHLALVAATDGDERSRDVARRAWRRFGKLPWPPVSYKRPSRE